MGEPLLNENIEAFLEDSYENELMGAREEALAEMAERAKALGADAIIGVKMDYEVLGSDNADGHM